MRVKAERARRNWFGAQVRHARVWLLGVLMCILVAPAAAQPSAKSVLILNTFSDLSLDNVNYIESAMRAHVPGPVNFYVEYLESWRLGDDGYERAILNTLEHEYAGQKLDLALPVSYPALQFILKFRDRSFTRIRYGRSIWSRSQRTSYLKRWLPSHPRPSFCFSHPHKNPFSRRWESTTYSPW
jgi:hypothetical protein